MENKFKGVNLIEWLIDSDESLKVASERIEKIIEELVNFSVEDYERAISDNDYSKFNIIELLNDSHENLTLEEVVIKLKAEIFDILVHNTFVTEFLKKNNQFENINSIYNNNYKHFVERMEKTISI